MVVEPVGMMLGDLRGALRDGGDGRTVPRVHDRWREPVELTQRFQICAQRIGCGLRPAPDVGSDLGQQHIATEHPSGLLTDQHDVAVGVPRQHPD